MSVHKQAGAVGQRVVASHQVQYTFWPLSLAPSTLWCSYCPGYCILILYQRRIHESLRGLEGVEDVVDDILCVGDTYESAVQGHDRNLIAILERCREKSIKLKVSYIGHVLTPHSVKPDPRKNKQYWKCRLPVTSPCEGCLG